MSTRKTTLFTMVATEDQTRLVQITGIEKEYPFYGKMFLKNNGVVESENVEQSLALSGEAWVYPELLFMLGLKLGGSLKIGEKKFKIADTVLDDPSSSFSSFGLAPRVYLAYSQMQETALLSKKKQDQLPAFVSTARWH